MASGIYEIVNAVNGKRYIGSTVDFERRQKDHRYRLKRFAHPNHKLQRSWDKYGGSAFRFSLLFICAPTKEALQFYEQRAIDTYKPEYNLAPVAGSLLGFRRSAETRAKMSLAQTGNTKCAGHQNAKGLVHTPAIRERISIAMRGKQHALGHKDTDQQRMARSLRQTGKKRGPYKTTIEKGAE